MGPATRDRRRACAAAALVVLAASGVVAGCRLDDDERGMGDAPVLNRRGDDTPAEVFNFPDHFGNLATKCVGHGLRGYTTTHFADDDGYIPSANTKIVPDPDCR
ncbi:conserved exported hypothetical protein [Parafrankia sp. Ea1.12]|uniref:hypothetical protein n=1 Tax=Parafrankia sp. Ea1.12 TaxID=573499 RepID=UPI000DA5C919|nr:hypothetical protein [Parafrankia sp. Ea1.12]SQD96067.1 conserved exported hypothetical protein [Parafrankia sp. Ea1.12]